MQRRLALAVLPLACAFLTGCFGSSSSSSNDAGFDFDTSFSTETGSDASHHDASPVDATQPETGPGDGGTDGPQGDGSASGVFSTAPVDFGPADCGGKPSTATQSYGFQNSGPVAITWSAAVTGPVFAIQGPASGTVAAGASGAITVGVTIVPATSTAGTALQDTLTITTNVPGFTTVSVPLTVTPRGGSLTLTGSTGLGSVTLGKTVTQPFTLTNAGNAPVSVTFGAPTNAQFALTYTGAPAATQIAPNQSLAGATASFTPSAAGPQSATAAIQVTGVLCASPATSLALTGTGTSSPLSIGPSPLDFSTVTCGATAPPQAITLQNSNGVAIPYTTALGQGATSPFTLDAPTGTVPANGKAVINVTPKAIPAAANLTAGAYNDTLTITPQGLTAVSIPLNESAGGAVLQLGVSNAHFGTVTNTTKTLPFFILNSGNQPATTTLAMTGTGFKAALTASNVVPPGGGSIGGNVSFTATTNGAASGTLSIAASNVCSPAPTPVTFDATAQVPVATFPKGKGPLDIAITCGGTAGTAASIQVHNAGNAPMNIVNPVSTGRHFTITGFTSPIPAGGTDTVGAIAIVGSALGSATPYADTLHFTTDEVGGPAYSIPVNVTVTGVNLALSPPSFAFTDCNNVNYSIVASGVLPAGSVVTVIGQQPPYEVGGGGVVGFGGLFNQTQNIVPGSSYPDVIYSNENSGCAPQSNISAFIVTGPVCQQKILINATYSGGACVGCGSSHS
jgi:hypothetical protein